MYLVEEETKLAKLRLLSGLLYKNLIEFIANIKNLSESEHLEFLFSSPELKELKELMLSIQTNKEECEVFKDTETILFLLSEFYNMSVYEQFNDYKVSNDKQLKTPQKFLKLINCKQSSSMIENI